MTQDQQPEPTLLVAPAHFVRGGEEKTSSVEIPDRKAVFTAQELRNPDDVPYATPLTWLAERWERHSRRLLNRHLPTESAFDGGTGTAVDALAELAVGAALVRTVARSDGHTAGEAVELGATWSEVAEALGVTPDEARARLRAYADEQRAHRLASEEDDLVFGLTAEEHAAMVALTERGDDERIAVETGKQG